jgi:hypothetical protein
LSFLPSDWVCNRNLPKLFYGWSPFWPHHKILKRNPGPDSLSDGAHGVSAKKIEVWLSQAFGILASWISQSFICHTYIITSVARAVGPSVTTSSTDFSFQNLDFLGIYLKFQWRNHSIFKNFCMAIPNVMEPSPCTAPHQDLSKDTKNTIWSIPVQWIS